MTTYVYAAAVAAMCLGVVLVYAGVIAGGMFVAGTVLVAIGMVLAAVGAVMQLASKGRNTGVVTE